MKNGKMGNEGRRAILQQHRGFSEAFCGPSALVLWGHLDIFPKQLLNFVKLTSKKKSFVSRENWIFSRLENAQRTKRWL